MPRFPRVGGDRTISGLEATWQDYERIAKTTPVEEIYRLSGEALYKVAERTEDPELSRKLLTDTDQLKAGLRSRYLDHGPIQDNVYHIREKGINDLIKRLQRLIRPSLGGRAKDLLAQLGFTRKKVQENLPEE